MIQEDDFDRLEEWPSGQQGMSAEELLHRLFVKYDLERDGRISKFEFHSILGHLAKITGSMMPNMEDVEEIFMLLDADGDRSIDEHEYNLLMKQFSSLFEQRGLKIRLKRKD